LLILIELEEIGIIDIRRAGDTFAFMVPGPNLDEIEIPLRLRMALEARRAELLPMLRRLKVDARTVTCVHYF
jgi:hypothetical protein